MRTAAPQPPTKPDRWAWERFYTDTVEHLMTARDGEPVRKPSEVALEAKTRTETAYLKTLGVTEAPVWLRTLGDPNTSTTERPPGT